jgi:serine/threonine protein kinase
MSETNRCSQCGAELPSSAPSGLCPACLLKQGLQTNTAGFTTQTPPRAAWTPPTVQEVAARFAELHVVRLIGRGGMGAVYEARQKNLDRVVALKILPPEMGNDAAFAERFTREARAMAKLNHPHIVTIHEFGQRDGWFYFLMEYVDGLTLRQVLDRGHIAPKEALAIVPEICDALQYAHDQGIVHRDIKPENILLNKQGQVKIADFGLAKLMGLKTSPETVEKVLGTPQYMAPEQIEHPAEVDHRADIYSLGVVFYQMLTGELPAGKFERPSRKVAIDVRLDDVVLRALEHEPGLRYQQASEVKTEIETISNSPMLQADAFAEPRTGFGGFLARWRRIVALLLGGITYTSRASIALANISALGILGSIAGLSVLPGFEFCLPFAAFFAFFGLIGIIAIIEFPAARQRANKIRPTSPHPPLTRLGRAIVVSIMAGLLFIAVGLFAGVFVWSLADSSRPSQTTDSAGAHLPEPYQTIARAIQRDVSHRISETGGAVDAIVVKIAGEHNGMTTLAVQCRGLQHFVSVDGTAFDNDDANFEMSYIGAAQWAGTLHGTQFIAIVGKVDNTNLAFVADQRVLGKWTTVDLAPEIEKFNPASRYLKSAIDFPDIVFFDGGKTSKPWYTWTNGVLMHSGDKTASKYEIREINGMRYMFLEWKNGDVIILNQKPWYVVLRLVSGPTTQNAEVH